MSTVHPEITVGSDALRVMQLEYVELFKEIRNIHELRLKIFSVLVSCIITITGYALAGAWIFLQTQNAETSAQVPLVIIYSYSALGIVLTATFYMVMYNVFNYIGPNKKHLVRYWKAIHLLRHGMSRITETDDYFYFPRSIAANMPRVSKRWDYGVLIYPLFNMFCFVLMAILLAPVFAIQDGRFALGIEDARPLSAATIVLWGIYMPLMAAGATAMRDYMRNLREAREMNESTPFINLQSDEATKLHREQLVTRQTQWLCIVVTVSLVWTICFIFFQTTPPSFTIAFVLTMAIWTIQLWFSVKYLAIHSDSELPSKLLLMTNKLLVQLERAFDKVIQSG